MRGDTLIKLKWQSVRFHPVKPLVSDRNKAYSHEDEFRDYNNPDKLLQIPTSFITTQDVKSIKWISEFKSSEKTMVSLTSRHNTMVKPAMILDTTILAG